MLLESSMLKASCLVNEINWKLYLIIFLLDNLLTTQCEDLFVLNFHSFVHRVLVPKPVQHKIVAELIPQISFVSIKLMLGSI